MSGAKSIAVTDSRLARRAVVVAVTLHLAGVAALIVGVTVAGMPAIDVLRPVPLGALFAAPAVLALLGLRGRGALLVVAAVCAATLALTPFSLHSFVLGPIAAVYLLAYHRLSGTLRRPVRVIAASLACPVLLVAALVVLSVGDEAACYTRFESGEVIVEAMTEQEMMSGRLRIEPDSGVVEGGCAGGIVTGWEALASLALSSTAVLAGALPVPPTAAPRT